MEGGDTDRMEQVDTPRIDTDTREGTEGWVQVDHDVVQLNSSSDQTGLYKPHFYLELCVHGSSFKFCMRSTLE